MSTRSRHRFAPFALFLLVFARPDAPAAYGQGSPGVPRMLNTKHNLSATGPGPLKAQNENQLCVFCHTPHVPSGYAVEQLWNHRGTSANYELYSSDYLTKLSYAAPNQPNPRSKLCLSCHDGTIALGAVYNNGGDSSTIPMQNNVVTMPPGAPGYLGTSLSNDHPVGYTYDNGRDPELVGRQWPWNTPVRLDPDAPTGTIECQTCHDPHDDTYSKFLRMSNTNAALCVFCHAKTGWTEAAHKMSTQPYTPPNAPGTTIGEWACRNCHTSHNGAGAPYLLTGVEENTCYASGCHGVTSPGVNTKAIQGELNKRYTHPTNSLAGRHKNPDNATSLNVPNRHAECQDCHNSHEARKGLHTTGENGVSNVLLGVRGVSPDPTPVWQQPGSYTEVKPSIEENQICFKCHSSYAFGTVSEGVTTILGPSEVLITDQAMEFNPANRSAHPVRVSPAGQTGSAAPRALDAGAMTADWSRAVESQTMYCSDCHGNDEATSATVPQGPHGAGTKFMLTGRGKYWPTGPSGQLWSLGDIRIAGGSWQTDLFCANCHTLNDGLGFKNNVHASASHQDARCVTCHVAVPHGSKRSRLIGYVGDPSPYDYNGAGPADKLLITGFQKAVDPLHYAETNCATSCHSTLPVGPYEP